MDWPTPYFEKPSSGQAPGADLLAAMYQAAPVMVVMLTADGVVVHLNAAGTRVTGYEERELAGKNFWAMLFPGRLFAQVPRFLSAVHPGQVLGQDVTMVLRTREGKERVVAWTRMVHDNERGVRTLVCFGTDLTDRLTQADLGEKGGEPAENQEGEMAGFAARPGDAGTVEGEVITPLAISPPVLPTEGVAGGGAAIQQVHEFLMQIDGRMEALTTAFAQGELGELAGIAGGLRDGARACGLLDFSVRAERLQAAATLGAMDKVSGLVQQIVTMCHPGREPGKGV